MKKFLALFVAAVLAAQSAYGSSLTLLGVGGGGTLDAFALTFDHSSVNATNQTTYSFATQAVGTDVTGANKRYTIVATGGSASAARTVSSATICGVAATEVVTDISSNAPASIFLADTSGLGTSCTIAVTYSAVMQNTRIGVWRLINPVSATPTANTCASVVTSTYTLSINISAGGAAVGTATSNSTTDRTFTWSGLTEAYDAVAEAGSASTTGANGGISGTPTTITATANAAPSSGTGCSASWAP